MVKFGSEKFPLSVDEELDLDGDLCFEIDHGMDRGNTYAFLNLEEVKLLVQHLQKIVEDS